MFDLRAEIGNGGYYLLALVFSMDSYLVHLCVQFDDNWCKPRLSWAPADPCEIVRHVQPLLCGVDVKLFLNNVAVSADSLMIAHDQSPPTWMVSLVEMFPYHWPLQTSLWSRGMQNFVTSVSGGSVSSIYWDCSIGVCVGGGGQNLWENYMSPTPSASNIFLNFPSIVCSCVSMITTSQSPSFPHLTHCVAKSLRNNSFGAVLMCLFWQYLFSCWYCVCKPSGFPLPMFYVTATLHIVRSSCP